MKDRRFTITTEQRQRIMALGMMDITFKEIAAKVGCASSTVAYVLRGKPKDAKAVPATPLSKFHSMEKSVNQLRPPDQILEYAHPVLIEMYLKARNLLDLYMATLGAEASDITRKQEVQHGRI